MKETLEKFGHPGSLVAETARWMVLARPQQVTLGSLVLIEKTGKPRFSELDSESFQGLGEIVSLIERTLLRTFSYDKINYLMLMMVDPEVHFHVIPRYAEKRDFEGVSFIDEGWPGPPQMDAAPELSDAQFAGLVSHLKSAFSE